MSIGRAEVAASLANLHLGIRPPRPGRFYDQWWLAEAAQKWANSIPRKDFDQPTRPFARCSGDERRGSCLDHELCGNYPVNPTAPLLPACRPLRRNRERSLQLSSEQAAGIRKTLVDSALNYPLAKRNLSRRNLSLPLHQPAC